MRERNNLVTQFPYMLGIFLFYYYFLIKEVLILWFANSSPRLHYPLGKLSRHLSNP